jgi:hypothetical protein
MEQILQTILSKISGKGAIATPAHLFPTALFFSHEKLIDDIAEIARLLPIWGTQWVEIIFKGAILFLWSSVFTR